MHVILDVSRLLFSARRATPTGIDRVEMAYARHWCRQPANTVTFAAQSPWGWFGAIAHDVMRDFTDSLLATWDHGHHGDAASRHALGLMAAARARLALGGGRNALDNALQRHRNPAFLLVSHRGLDRMRPIAALRRKGAKFVPFLHDMIPLTHPEYTRPSQIKRHHDRITSLTTLADGLLVNSAATADSLAPWYAGAARPPIVVAPLGADSSKPAAAATPDPPYFVCLGTIEPRKNHLLLLTLWRRLAEELGPAAPRLMLIGRRGWENENIVDMLDRCAALRGLVVEHGCLPDRDVRRLLAGAKALLFPSFAEGYGLPLAEALALGVPAICSDLPALHEVGGQVPDYLDPLDGPAWRRAVLDYAAAGSVARAAQCARMAGWQAPRWDDHFNTVAGFVQQLVAAPMTARRPTAKAMPPLSAQPAISFASLRTQ